MIQVEIESGAKIEPRMENETNFSEVETETDIDNYITNIDKTLSDIGSNVSQIKGYFETETNNQTEPETTVTDDLSVQVGELVVSVDNLCKFETYNYMQNWLIIALLVSFGVYKLVSKLTDRM